ncbi:hypothetical protein [Natrinema gari]|uniref:hypothetical protein n=1 Tax=Natrinema gari TaxID=419186 RepID=UPI00126805E2|nr:hypothetical protein [Natrinema gari]
MQPYKKLEDVVPHEENILILTTSDTCFNYDFSDIVEEIREGIRGDKLLIEEYYHSLSDLSNRDKLIQNSVWVIHWNECLKDDQYPQLGFYLETRSYPNEAEVIICVDGGSATVSKVESEYPHLTVASSKEQLVAYSRGHLNTANPITKGGRKKIKRWNEEVCEDLGVI